MAEVFTVGRVCFKTKGRDAGSRVVVVATDKDGFVMVEGAFTKKTRTNTQHLLPTTHTVTLPSGYTHDDVLKVLKEELIAHD